MKISLELVPRSIDVLQSELSIAAEYSAHIDAINIPDLIRFDLRSWDAHALVDQLNKRFVPHVRAIDFDLRKGFSLQEYFIANKIDEVLVIRGDDPHSIKRIYPTTTIDMIKAIKTALPAVKVYGAIDPYRSDIRAELEYVRMKNDAGADGYFTQPFFDRRLIEIYAEHLMDETIYWGVSPVLSEQSKHYWEAKNRAVFPASFRYDDEWNISFARDVLSFCRSADANIYFMPIRTDLRKYLSAVFSI